MAAPDLGPVLLALARKSIADALGVAAAGAPPHPALAAPGATFVTLRKGRELRGCIGSVAAYRALGPDVQANALAAAFRDPRFAPLALREYGSVAIEVSLLGASEPLRVANEREALAALRPGLDGVALECGYHRSTFLPQVWEQLPDPAEFMEALKRKAGLPARFWSPQVELSRYTVDKFAEGAPEGVNP